ncbi:MAG: response regulator [Planctomycetes bacterium]|jgi:DNA-binding NtrC family response regulator|nr:response regulator [Planctomycetota bacterium]
MNGERILLVDDEDEFAQLLSERLESRGLRVDTAGNGLEALDKVKKGDFDVVVLDMVMPVMDGIETLERLREERPELQIILLTGHATVEKGVQAIKLGAADFLEKPADIDALMEKIRTAKVKKTLLVEKRMKGTIDDILGSKSW